MIRCVNDAMIRSMCRYANVQICRCYWLLVGAIVVLAGLNGCTTTVPDYTSAEEDNGSPWIDVYGDTAKDVSVYIAYSQNQVVASMSMYIHPDSVSSISDADVFISEYNRDSSELQLKWGAFPGTDYSYLNGSSFRKLRPVLTSECDTFSCETLYLQVYRVYKIASESDLPETLELRCEMNINTDSGRVVHVFKKILQEEEQVMRLH